MRWLVAALGVIGLAGGVYFGLEPRLRRPTLRIALELRPLNSDDDALAAGVALALDERDERAGRFRVKAAHQIRHPNRSTEFPTPRAHTMLYGVEAPQSFPGPAGPLLGFDSRRQEEGIRAWMRERSLERLTYYSPYTRHSGTRLKSPDDPQHEVLESRPDVVLLDSTFGGETQEIQHMRAAGFQGPVFISFSSWWFRLPSLSSLEGAYLVLAPLKPAPPEFQRRHPHPFAYTGYRGTIRYLDALDANLQGNPMEMSRGFGTSSIFDELKDEPRVYQVRGGQLHPAPSK